MREYKKKQGNEKDAASIEKQGEKIVGKKRPSQANGAKSKSKSKSSDKVQAKKQKVEPKKNVSAPAQRKAPAAKHEEKK